MSPLRKRHTRQHVIADLSFNYVERLILRSGWVARRHLQQALRAVELRIDDPPADTITFHIPMENILDEAAILSFAKLRDAAVANVGDRAW